jgi:hypothetical protein
VVKSGPEIVNRISYNKRPLGIVWPHLMNPKMKTVLVRVVIGKGQMVILFRATPRLDRRMELLEVVFGTVDLGSNAG